MKNSAFLIPGIALSLAVPSLALAGDNEDSTTFRSYGVEYMQWDETIDREYASHNFVSEAGPIFHVTGTHGSDWHKRTGLYDRITHDFKGGIVRYDGELAQDYSVEIDGLSLYVGYEHIRQYGYRWTLSDNISFSPYAAIGVDIWSRSILSERYEDPDTGERERASAYEVYAEPYGAAGIQASYWRDNGDRLSLNIGKKRPFTVIEYSESASDFHAPKPKWATTASIEYATAGDTPHLMGVQYRDREYGKSDTNSEGWYQPDISSHSITFYIGWAI